jgi:hypothetical protein
MSTKNVTTAQNIKDWIDRAVESGIEREDVVFLMVEIRHLMEGQSDISDYRVTELYCDWMVHTNLYTSDGGLIIIKELTRTLVKNWSERNENLVHEMSQIFGLSSLRTELIKLFDKYSIPTVIFSENENWKNVVGFLTYYLRGKPINLPSQGSVKKQRLKKLIGEIERIKKPVDFYIKKVSIVGKDSPFWCIELGGEKNTTKIVGELSIEKDF